MSQRRLSLNPTPFVGLFLILAVIPPALRERSKGLAVEVAADQGEGECRSVIIRVVEDGEVSVTGDPLTRSELQRRLEEFFRTRVKRVVFVTSQPDIPFQQVADVIGVALREVDYVGILTPSVERELKPWDCLAVPPPSQILILGHPKPPIELRQVPLWPW